MYIELKDVNAIPPFSINGICPHCGHAATFLPLHNINDAAVRNDYILGQRKCPNKQCNGHIFYIYEPGTDDTTFYPTAIITFDKENIPEKVLSTFEEALICHGNQCYVAAGIMIRKTLEVICEDREAVGDNLYQRLNNLAGRIVIPQELRDGLHELRLLGNDAAHVESKTFNQVGKVEIELSIEITKEILKGVYQYESLVSRLRALKRGTGTPPTV